MLVLTTISQRRWLWLTLLCLSGLLIFTALLTQGEWLGVRQLLHTNPRVEASPASNSTLGVGAVPLYEFEAILALSRGTPWRVDGLHAAALKSGITIEIPAQPTWSEPFIEAFRALGPTEARGAAMAWLGHIDLLRLVVQNRWESALILEDDVDWSVDIRRQTSLIADAVRDLTSTRGSDVSREPYGMNWDVLWMGHCGDPPDFSKPHKVFADNTVLPLAQYQGINRHIAEVLEEGQRSVHYSQSPVCTWAYAVTAEGARKVLFEASLGKGGAFDLMLMAACRENRVKCVTVNPQIFSPYHPAEGDESEVGAGDHDETFRTNSSGKLMGSTENVLRSARCAALFKSTCVYEPRMGDE